MVLLSFFQLSLEENQDPPVKFILNLTYPWIKDFIEDSPA